MSRFEKYIQCLEIRIEHRFYAGTPPVALELDTETAIFFRRTGRVFRSLGNGRWIVLRREEEHEEFAPTFKVTPTDPLFYYVTERADDAEVEIVMRQGTWGILKCLSDEVVLRFHSPEKYLEFVLIPRHTNSSAMVEMREVRGRVEFTPPERVELLGMQGARRVLSKEKVPLTEKYEHRFLLIEIMDSGERVLSSCIPPPRPDESSIATPQGTITTYFYY